MKKIIILISFLLLAGCQTVSKPIDNISDPGKTVDPKPVKTSTINNFDDCIKAGNPAMESYPRQCRAGDRTFTEVIDDPVTPPSSDDVPQICTMDYTPVCALIQVQCFTTPCPPLFQTKSNEREEIPVAIASKPISPEAGLV